jgi:hypothetical protein
MHRFECEVSAEARLMSFFKEGSFVLAFKRVHESLTRWCRCTRFFVHF